MAKKLDLVQLGDCDVVVFCHSRHDRVESVQASRLHNKRVMIDGVAYVLCVGEPDEETERLAGEGLSSRPSSAHNCADHVAEVPVTYYGVWSRILSIDMCTVCGTPVLLGSRPEEPTTSVEPRREEQVGRLSSAGPNMNGEPALSDE